MIGLNTDPAAQPFGTVPQLPPSPFSARAGQAAPAPSLPAPPPRRRSASLWDEGNRSQTLLAIGAGLLSGHSFGEGLANASRNLMDRRDRLEVENRQLHKYGGPDGAFDITTDPRTGERSVREVPQFRDYLDHKRVKPRDTADLNGRAMYALSQLPEANRPAAYSAMRANPEQFGIDPSTMPEAYDPSYVGLAANMGMTVAQATGRDLRASDAASRDKARGAAQSDRQQRTDIYRARSAAATNQGQQRVDIARSNAARAGAKGPGKAKAGTDPRYEYRVLPDGRVQQRLKR